MVRPTHVNISQLVKSLLPANKSSTSCVCRLVTRCQQFWNKLLPTCNNLVDIIRLVTRLFKQDCYNHDITILLQPCAVNVVTFLLYIVTVSDLLEQPCNKSYNAIELVTSCQQLLPNLLQQTRNKQSVQTQLVNKLTQLVCRLVTTSAFLSVVNFPILINY